MNDVNAAAQRSAGNYASVNGLEMYYEVHGRGHGARPPLLLMHGGFQTIEALRSILSALARTRQVIAVELEGHGRTADLDRPLSHERMAEDVAGLLDQLGVERADIFGYSLSGITSLRLAIRHPHLVRKLVVVSTISSNEGFYPATMAGWPSMSVEGFVGTPMERDYAATAPDPAHWPVFVDKMKHILMEFPGWPASEIQSIAAPTLILLGDADFVRPEHAIEMFRLLGGAREDGGMGPLPASQLAVLPGTTHFNILDRIDLLLPIITRFLDAPEQ